MHYELMSESVPTGISSRGFLNLPAAESAPLRRRLQSARILDYRAADFSLRGFSNVSKLATGSRQSARAPDKSGFHSARGSGWS